MIQTGILLIHFLMHGVMFNPPSTLCHCAKWHEIRAGKCNKKKMIRQLSIMKKNNIQSGEVDASFVEKYGSPEHEFVRPRYMFVGEYYIGLEKNL